MVTAAHICVKQFTRKEFGKNGSVKMMTRAKLNVSQKFERSWLRTLRNTSQQCSYRQKKTLT